MRRSAHLAPVLLALVTGAAALGCTSSGASVATPPATSAPAGTTATTEPTATTKPTTTTAPDDEDDTTTTKKKGTTTTASGSDDLPGVNADGEITDARVIREFLFNTVEQWGEQGLDPEQLAEGLNATFPSLDLSGYQVDSTPTRISTFSGSVQEKGENGPDNPYVVVFTVMQVDGTCLGGIIYGYPTATQRIELEADAGDRCAAMPLYEARVEGQQLP